MSTVARGPEPTESPEGERQPSPAPEPRGEPGVPPPVPDWVSSEQASPAPRAGSRLRHTVRTSTVNRAELWGTDPYRDQDALLVGSRRRAQSADRSALLARLDPRGIFVAVVSALLLPACALTYYNVPGVTRLGKKVTPTYTVIAHAFGSWRVLLPVLAGLAIVVGIVNAFMQVAAPGAVTVFVALRLVVIAQLGLWVLAAVQRTPHGAAFGSGGIVTVTWVAWAAIGIAAVAVLGSFASMGKNKYS